MYWAAGIALFKAGRPPPPPGDFTIAASPDLGHRRLGRSDGLQHHQHGHRLGTPQTVALSATGLPTGATGVVHPAVGHLGR